MADIKVPKVQVWPASVNAIGKQELLSFNGVGGFVSLQAMDQQDAFDKCGLPLNCGTGPHGCRHSNETWTYSSAGGEFR